MDDFDRNKEKGWYVEQRLVPWWENVAIIILSICPIALATWFMWNYY